MVDLNNLRRKYNGVPILSWNEIDIIAEKTIEEFSPELLKKPQPVDIDLFLQDYLKLHMEYHYLSNNGSILGMMIYQKTNGIITYDPEAESIAILDVDADTVLLDSTLLEKDQTRRYRFTAAHEGGHALLHRLYHYMKWMDRGCFGGSHNTAPDSYISCRKTSINVDSKALISDYDWMEWQANAFASALLMPKTAIQLAAQKCRRMFGSVCDENGNTVYEQYVSDVFGVSRDSARCRLNQLGIYTTAKLFAPTSEELDEMAYLVASGQAVPDGDSIRMLSKEEQMENAFKNNMFLVTPEKPRRRRASR